jgi:hypothetical protein
VTNPKTGENIMKAVINVAMRKGVQQVMGTVHKINGVSVVAHQAIDGRGWTVTEARTGRAITNGGIGSTKSGELSAAKIMLEKESALAQIAQFETLNHAFALQREWSGSPCPVDPDNYWVNDETGERVKA